MGDVTKVDVGANGVAYVGAVGSTAPTTATAAPAAAFKNLGFCSEDGLVEGQNLSFTEIKAWDGSTVRKIVNSAEKTFKLVCLESNGNVMGLHKGANSTIAYSSPTTTITNKTPGRDLRAFIVDVIDGSVTRRFYIPNGEVTDRDDVTYSTAGAAQYGMTISAYPDSGGVTHYEFINADRSPV